MDGIGRTKAHRPPIGDQFERSAAIRKMGELSRGLTAWTT